MNVGRRYKTMLRGLLLAVALLTGIDVAQAQGEGYAGIPGTVVRFATVAQGRAVLGAEDEWIAATTDFQRAAILGVAPSVTRAQLLAFTVDTVKPWSAPQEARWRKALDAIAPRFAALHLNLPAEVLLVNTDGRDAAGAPYTRANAVVLPMRSIDAGAEGRRSDAGLLSHELFHVVSRHAPALATKLYATIGFEPVAALQWPAQWLPARIVNPDAPHDRHAMRVSIGGRSAIVMPLLMAKRTDLRPGESFFSVADVRLLEVTSSASGPTLPVMRDGEPVWHMPGSVPDFLDKLGANTGYIIHPEETMADNIALLVTGARANNRELLKRIEAVLLEPR
ncbi:MAG: hypothetical protein ABI781_17795 [Burkholderiales bacterium]